MKKNLTLYPLLITGFVGMVWLTIEAGTRLRPPGPVSTLTQGSGQGVDQAWWAAFADRFHDPICQLFLQLIVIVALAQWLGRLAERVGQPPVIGEMVAGILLGPSLLGWLAPGTFHVLFPETSWAALKLLSQIGVCLFLFGVGLEMNLSMMRQKARTAVVVSNSSIFVPFLLGCLLAFPLFPDLAGPKATYAGFALFLGISVSITAFPVLARVLRDRGLSNSPLGQTALTCAAVDDATAWSVLAVVVAIVQAHSVLTSLLSIGLLVLFVLIMWTVVRPLIAYVLRRSIGASAEPSHGALTIAVAVLLLSALSTEVLGVHALFGAFLAGVIMPPAESFRKALRQRLEGVSALLLLPIFFAYTGLRTHLGLLGDAGSLLLCAGIIAVAMLGKSGGTMAAARWSGVSLRESFSLGVLMNCRGLMELVALNIGYDLGLLSPRLFAMMVIMALVTTFLTGPLLTWSGERKAAIDEGKSLAGA